MYYYGARYVVYAEQSWSNPRISIFVSVDPLAEQTMTPYQYVTNNPIMFTDPTGMEQDGIYTELYNTDGKKIGEDANGKDGKVSIISDEDRASAIAKNYKKGGVASAEDVASGLQTTKAVLEETLYNLEEAKKIKDGSEVKSVVDPNGVVTRGTAPTVLNDGAAGVTRTELPYVEGNDNVSIHSHNMFASINPKTQGILFDSALRLGPDDPGTFKKFSLNIIVGRLGDQTGRTIKDASGVTKTVLDTPQDAGAAFYLRSKTTPSLTLKEKAIRAILK